MSNDMRDDEYYKRMFQSACSALAAICEALGLDPNDDADAAIAEINNLQRTISASAGEGMPGILFDGYAVYQEVKAAGHDTRTSPENVSDTLDAVVRLMKSAPLSAENEGEREKMGRDVALYGQGFMVGGKHVPLDQVLVRTAHHQPLSEAVEGGAVAGFLTESGSFVPIDRTAHNADDLFGWKKLYTHQPSTLAAVAAAYRKCAEIAERCYVQLEPYNAEQQILAAIPAEANAALEEFGVEVAEEVKVETLGAYFRNEQITDLDLFLRTIVRAVIEKKGE